ncbi:CLUMA_CG018472, isoform A [Clunio marinus]|uniref:CLUMA_CG018472, isoform A n=1 Tax=Clunio marinus TaxID=568069 RepID=A0A1J1IZS5_9DIPT|nr:CLUMA_CG018472, isoform A [Clunio marinus]
MILSLKLLLIVTSVAIAPIRCATCHFYLDEFLFYGCEMFDVNVTEENQPFEITGEHLPGYSDSNVRWLNVTDSGIMNFIPNAISETFRSISNLVDFGGVQLKELNPEAFQFRMIRTINLDKNLIKKIPPRAFNGCLFLRYLNLDNNLIDTLADFAFYDNIFLRHLILSNNLLTTLPETAFVNLTLTHLYLDNNRLVYLPENVFSTLQLLNVLNLDNNLLVSIPPRLMEGTRIRELYLNSNQLESLDLGGDEDFAIFFSLNEVYARNNRINALQENLFRRAALVRIFEAGWNNINTIHPNAFNRNLSISDLSHIGLSHNNLTEIIPGTFHGLLALMEIKLNSNRISALTSDDFVQCPSTPCLRPVILDLSDNELEIIHSQFFVNMARLRTLNLSSNKISAIDRHSIIRVLKQTLKR